MRITSLQPTGMINKALEFIHASNWMCPNETEKDYWHIGTCAWNFIEESKKEMKLRDKEMNIVYLTGDSDEDLETVDNNTIYIVGALLDHNSLKFASLKRAKELNLKTARLPISKYITTSQRNILAINHVFEILLKYQELNDWGKAFLAVLPNRMDPKLI